ncbi:MAG: F0F1 ATP synthase subunit epsilon [Candidatus Gracilibacteria bacterium]|nr:F0F1 ATP synthase subunit epsilon [Candidatus Gracilibacteria bacterium]
MDTKKTFKLTVKTPTENVYEGEVNSLLVDTELGRMMVLPHHAALVGSITFSDTIISADNKLRAYNIRTGFLSIDNDENSVEILCNHCEQSQTLTYTSVEKYLEFLQGELQSENLNPYQLEFLENEKFAVVKQLKTLKKD